MEDITRDLTASPVLVADANLPTSVEKRATFESAALGPRKPRCALVNPPGSKRYFRDYFCTLVSKAHYYYHPVDLVYLSGVLDRAGYHLLCHDAIASQRSVEESIADVVSFQPEVVVYLLASPSYEEDVAYLTALKQRLPNAAFVGSGDVYREIREDGLTLHSFCDAILTDFSTTDLVTWLTRTSDMTVDNLIYRGADGAVRAGAEKHGHGFYAMPVPRWDLWPHHGYRFPFSEQKRWATMLTDFGCPFSCTFCPMSTTGYKLRDLDTVMDELRLLRALGIHEVFFRDQTFGVNRVRTQELLRRIKLEFPELRWTCWSRVDLVTEEFLQAIHDAGCHTVMFGIESANEEILKRYKKNTTRSQMERALLMARRIGLKTVGTFVVGLPGESEESIRFTIEYACRLPLDYGSFNIATPRFGSTFRRIMRESGSLDTTRMSFDSSRAMPAWLTDDAEEGAVLPNETIFRLQQLAIRRFYLRPAYLLRRALTMRSAYQCWNHAREAWDLLFTPS
jgi:anaerobic magnesium-protoporphyrin IX monomethyl ester cyclase